VVGGMVVPMSRYVPGPLANNIRQAQLEHRSWVLLPVQLVGY